jgi:uncharacterized MAPEG superfamily protein
MLTTVQAVVWSGILTLVMILVAAALCAEAWTPEGMTIAFGNRDRVPPPSVRGGRADRAAMNMLVGLVLLLAAVLAAHIAGKSAQAAAGATVFFWARVVYWPVYIAGIMYLRTAVWTVSIIGLAMIVWQI